MPCEKGKASAPHANLVSSRKRTRPNPAGFFSSVVFVLCCVCSRTTHPYENDRPCAKGYAQMVLPNALDSAVIAAQVEVSWYKNNLLNAQLWYEYHGREIDVYFWR